MASNYSDNETEFRAEIYLFELIPNVHVARRQHESSEYEDSSESKEDTGPESPDNESQPVEEW
jgi:hypothetical protein